MEQDDHDNYVCSSSSADSILAFVIHAEEVVGGGSELVLVPRRGVRLVIEWHGGSS